MRKTLYVVFACCLSLLIIYTLIINVNEKSTSRRTYVPTAQFLLRVQEENRQEQLHGGIGEETEKTAYLSFDDGPSEVTPAVLDTLKEKEVKATFFLLGNEITPEREDIVKREMAEGHTIGVHTQTHKRNIYGSYDSFFEDFDAVQERIRQVTGEEAKVHRYPWGSTTGLLRPLFHRVTAELQSRGVQSYDWNASGEDSLSDGIGGAQIKANVKKHYGLYNEPIILLHDSNVNKNTALILGEIIDMLREDGYQFDTLENRDPYLTPEEWRK